ncbi:MAG: FHA domain-containing protein, partial [Planctomycetes bacterium]|nr:FHA domain-containing protein [Planctomycetota bacterium]
MTAGPGSAVQKTWNLRRPCTLIGSRRPAHILLHGRDMSAAHCVIVNTGREVLLKDLHTSAGTLCNTVRIGLTVLSDGDVITLGDTKIQVAIKSPQLDSDDSGCGNTYTDPTTFRDPVSLTFVHTDRTWLIHDAVALVGRHRSAFVHLDHETISSRHAVLFRFDSDLAFFNLGGVDGILLNGEPTAMARLRRGDRMRLGPFSLCVGGVGAAETRTSDAEPSALESSCANPDRIVQDRLGSGDRGNGAHGNANGPVNLTSDAVAIGSELDSLRKGITEAWKRLNISPSEFADEGDEPKQDESEAENELDARDAALRGHFHDLTVLQEQLHDREPDVTAMTVR